MSEYFVQYVPAARALPEGHYAPCNADLPVTLTNLQHAADTITPFLSALHAALPEQDLTVIPRLPALCMATMHAATLCDASTGKSTERHDKLARATQLRDPMLLIAEGLALMGLLDRDEIAVIRSRSGAYGRGQNLLELVGQFRTHATVLAGKHPFDAAWLTEAADVGTWIITHITPAGAVPPEDSTHALCVADRDRLWQLVKTGYETLWRAAVHQWGTAASEHVPALQTRVHHAAVSKPATPVTAPAPAVR